MFRLITFFAAVAVLSSASSAFANSQQIGTFKSWNAYVSEKDKGEQAVCYISSKPVAENAKPRSGVFAEVTHRPAEHHLGVIDFLQSYTFKANAPATLTIGTQVFTMFTKGVAAFAKDDDDARIVAAMRSGAATMVFAGTDKKGKTITDTFSLAGMEQAYQAIGKACKVPASAAPKPVKSKSK